MNELRGRFAALQLPITEMRVDFIGLNSIHGPLAAQLWYAFRLRQRQEVAM